MVKLAYIETRWALLCIVITSVISQFIYISLFPIYVTSDTPGYMLLSLFISGNYPDLGPIYRLPGYSLLLWFTGYPQTGSLLGIVFLQSMMAVAEPVLIFLTLRRIAFWPALVTGLACAASLASSFGSTTIMTEFAYTFGIVLAVFGLSSHLQSRCDWGFVVAIVGCLFSLMIRPTGQLVLICFLAVALVYVPRRRTVLLALYGVLIAGIAVGTWLSFRNANLPEPLKINVPLTSTNTTFLAGPTLFSLPFLHGVNHAFLHDLGVNPTGWNSDGMRTITADNGPATRELFRHLSNSETFRVREMKGNQDEAAVAAMFLSPAFRTVREWYQISNTITAEIGLQNMDTLLGKVAIESIIHNPCLWIAVADHTLRAAYALPYAFMDSALTNRIGHFQIQESIDNYSLIIGNRAIKDIHNGSIIGGIDSYLPELVSLAKAYMMVLFNVIRIASMMLIPLGLYVAYRTPAAGLFIFCVITISLHYATIAVAAIPIERYVATLVPLNILLLGITASALWRHKSGITIVPQARQSDFWDYIDYSRLLFWAILFLSGIAVSCGYSLVTRATVTFAATFLNLNTRPTGLNTGIVVLSATYGGNCGVQVGNVSKMVASSCNGHQLCTYPINVQILDDPANGCGKDFIASWTCGTDNKVRSVGAPAGVGFGEAVELFCPPTETQEQTK